MDKPILQVLNGESLCPPPLWIMRQAGRYLPEYRKLRQSVSGFLELCYTPELAAEVTLQPIRRFELDAAILFSDILVIPHALGMDLDFVAGEGPKLDAIKEVSYIEKLNVEDVAERLSPVYETVKQVKKELPEKVTMIGFAGSPWTVSTYMIEGGSSKDFPRFLRFVREQPEAFHRLMQLLVNATIDYLKRQIEAGAEVIQLFESWASLATKEECATYIYPYTKQIVDALHASYPNIPIIGFPRKIGPYLEDYIAGTAINAVGLDENVMASQAQNIPVPIQGNLSNQLLADDMDTFLVELEKKKEQWRDRPWICNLGHGILPHTPIAHVEAFVARLRALS